MCMLPAAPSTVPKPAKNTACSRSSLRSDASLSCSAEQNLPAIRIDDSDDDIIGLVGFDLIGFQMSQKYLLIVYPEVQVCDVGFGKGGVGIDGELRGVMNGQLHAVVV